LADFLYQVPGLAVVGLLFVRAAALTGHRTTATQHLSEMTSRWAWVWAAASIVQLALTASELTGESIAGLVRREDVFAVLGRSGPATAQIVTLWVALAIALFASRLTSSLESLALTVLATAVLLPVVESVPGGSHDPASEHSGLGLHWLAMVALAVQLVAIVVWFGVLLAVVLHLRVLPLALGRTLQQFAYTASVCALLLGSTGLVQDTLTLPTLAALWQTTHGQLILAKVLALLLLVSVGFRHRLRTSDALLSGRVLRLVAGEAVLMGAVVAITILISPAL
jgi:putative copper export protein